jgi:hypothetical protein
MSFDPVKNFIKIAIPTGYTSGITSVVLSAGDGAKLPQPSIDGAFNLVWYNSTDYSDPSDDPNVEIIRCTARVDDTLTITRGQEGTIDVNHNSIGKIYKFILSFTKKNYDDISNNQIYYFGESNGESSTTSSYPNYVNKLTLNCTPVAGTYLMQCTFEIVNSGAGNDSWVRGYNGVVTYFESRINSDVTYTNLGWKIHTCFYVAPFLSVPKIFYIDFCRHSVGTAYIRNVRILLRRINN